MQASWRNFFVFLVFFICGCGSFEHIYNGQMEFLGPVFLLFLSFNLPFNILMVKIVRFHRFLVLERDCVGELADYQCIVDDYCSTCCCTCCCHYIRGDALQVSIVAESRDLGVVGVDRVPCLGD